MTATTTTPPARQLDPITFEVLRRSFEYAPERMSQVLQKASFSPIIYDMVDYSNAIFDPNVELIGQTANCPVHIAAMHFSARVIGAIPARRPAPRRHRDPQRPLQRWDTYT